ncbi:hypothetical protein GCM10007390_03970 [Persicitalea jodogahamensis]|uniref:Carotenoid biosynthesis protein n=2 Tax=Persicitalea jodogahamensis TaxID=402147 RepID=A0A8J3G7Y5_9BACT|nr:hypothetical protein GCM10007390_03970 [Persicitalea jodogahamensis]
MIFVILPLMYLAGLIGLNVPASAPLFQLLTPLNLVASLILLLLFHTDFRLSFWAYCIVAFTVGFLVEVAGVHTGVIFGEYAYGKALGFKIAEVPLVIGTNWLMLSYLCGSVINRLSLPLLAKVLLAAGLMTLLDFVIEPIAIRLDFWQWQAGAIPLQNYLAWYGISALLFFLFYKLPFRKENSLAPLLLVLQFLFFGLNSLIHAFN